MNLQAERLRELLAYNHDTGVFTWRVRRGPSRAGSVAGSKQSNGYLHIMIDGRDYKAHRLAWLHVHGSWPVEHIDHINGDPADNRLANLRDATQSQNMKNSRLQLHNTSGFKGVSRNRGRWIAHIRHEGRLINLGRFDTAEAAHAAYVAAAIRLAGEYANDGRGPVIGTSARGTP